MSLNESLIKNINLVIGEFINIVSEKFKLDRNELNTIWNSGENRKENSLNKLTEINMEDLSLERLNKCSKDELKALCKSRGLKVSGSKAEMVQRLIGGETEKKNDAVFQEPTKEPVKKGAKNKIISKITAQLPLVPIRRNKYDNFEHPETRIVFNRNTQIAIGKQQDDGTIAELTDEDIEQCKKFKFKYSTPDNLDRKDTLNNVKIDELGNDSEDDILETGEEVDDEVLLEEEEEEDVIIDDEDE